MTERILILGAGVYQVPLITAASRRGLETVVASRPGPYPGCALADTFLPLDIAEAEACLDAARQYGITAVATTGADAGLPTLGRIVDALDLPGPGLAATELSTDKVRMKQAFQRTGVPSASFGVFTAVAPARDYAAELGYPVMVKPPDSSGSRGVIRVDDPTGLVAAWREAATHSRSGAIIVERFLAGHEYGAQAVVHGDRVAAIFSHDDTVAGTRLSTPVGHAMPIDLSPRLIARTEEVVAGAVAALGLRDCVANVDLMLVDDEPHVIEIGARAGATGIPEMINLFTGWNLYDHVLDLALGSAGPVPAAAGAANAVTLLRTDRTGTVLSLTVPPAVRNHPDLVALQWDVAPGDQVRAFRVGPDRLGLLQARGRTMRAARDAAEALRAQIRIMVKESS